MACAICETRRPRRFCPGVRGDICAICCGTEREMTVTCPFECEYLQQARRHERLVPLDPEKIPYRDVPISEQWVAEHPEVLSAIGQAISAAAFQTPGTVDFDVREALDCLIRTYRTLESGVYYESRPESSMAAQVFAAVRHGLEQYRTAERQNTGMTQTRDADVLRALVFMARLELDRNNERKKGRAFLDLLRQFYAAPAASSDSPSSLVLP
jgi:hypothetical protein